MEHLGYVFLNSFFQAPKPGVYDSHFDTRGLYFRNGEVDEILLMEEILPHLGCIKH